MELNNREVLQNKIRELDQRIKLTVIDDELKAVLVEFHDDLVAFLMLTAPSSRTWTNPTDIMIDLIEDTVEWMIANGRSIDLVDEFLSFIGDFLNKNFLSVGESGDGPFEVQIKDTKDEGEKV